MDCRQFRDQHAAYVDDVMCADDMDEMQRHAERCPRCARHDTMVRRGLLLARNLPPVHCSADFMERLQARLRELDRMQPGTVEREARWTMLHGAPSLRFALLAASILGVAALASLYDAGPAEPIRLAPVVASAPEPPPAPAVTSPLIVEALATGIPVWPTVLMVGQPPSHVADVELQQASLRP